MKKSLMIGVGIVALAIIAFFVWGNQKTKRLQAVSKECTEKNLCLDADNFVCVECEEKKSNAIKVETAMWNGIISKAEVTSYQYGTHQLTGNVLDGNTDNVGKEILFALKSDKVNLDEWLGKKVIITGSKVAGYPVENGPDLIEATAIEADQMINAVPETDGLKKDLSKMKWEGSGFSGFTDNNNPFGKDKPEIIFTADGKVAGKFCNTINGTYEILKDNKIKLHIAKTKISCNGNIMLAENFIRSEEYDLDITKGLLNLINSKGESMSFTRATTTKENPMAN